MSDRDLTCDEAEALLPLVADGAIDAAADPMLFQHLATCSRCQDSLTQHDLVSFALTQPPPAQLVLRPAAPRRLGWPLAAAALLAVGLGLAMVAGTQPAAASAPAQAPSSPLANLRPAGPSQPATSTVSPRLPPAAEPIDIEVVTVPGSTARHPHYLVRRGEQVMLVDPAEPEDQAPPSEAKAASLRY